MRQDPLPIIYDFSGAVFSFTVQLLVLGAYLDPKGIYALEIMESNLHGYQMQTL